MNLPPISQMKKLSFQMLEWLAKLTDVVSDRTEAPTPAFRTRSRTLSQITSQTVLIPQEPNVSRDPCKWPEPTFTGHLLCACSKPFSCSISSCNLNQLMWVLWLAPVYRRETEAQMAWATSQRPQCYKEAGTGIRRRQPDPRSSRRLGVRSGKGEVI